jgi:hypothetical protein
MSANAQWLFSQMIEAVPKSAPSSVVEWAEANVLLVGSARSEHFRSSITPWTREPIECANDGTRRMTFIKPIQAGGTSVGEIAICFWLANWNGGDIQYNWPNDLHADARWKKHIEKKLKACAPVMDRTSTDRFAWTNGLVIFPHLNFIVQGINTDRSVTGDSVRGQVNEELHDSDNWIPGRLEQAYGRTTAFWNSVVFNISNAGRKGDQLHQAFLSGTQQYWEVLCPGCRRYHAMRTRWENDKPELGGLRYELGDRMPGEEPDYSKIQKNIHYQMPCGFAIHEDARERKQLSLSGRYGEPQNKRAQPGWKSFALEAVSVDYISWIDLVRQKHLALRSRRLGDPLPWLNYLRERECQFIGTDDRRPESSPIILSSRKKDREGLKDRKWRLAVLDYQTGRKDLNETSHFWGCIQDFDEIGNSLIVFEGKLESEGEVLDALRRHDVKPVCVAVDASWLGEDRYVYFFCLKHGFNCFKVFGIKGGGERTFTHEDGVRRAWSEPEPLWPKIAGQQGPSKNDADSEPEYWNVSQQGCLDSLAHRRGRKDIKYEIPIDVSEDFKAHFLPWQMEEFRVAATNQIELRWKKASEKSADHLFMACCYLSLWSEMAGIGEDVIEPVPEKPVVNEPVST